MKRREVIQASARFRRAGRTTAPHFCFGSLSSVFLRSDSNGDEKAPLTIDGRFAAELDAFTDHVQVKGYQRVIIQPFEYKKSYKGGGTKVRHFVSFNRCAAMDSGQKGSSSRLTSSFDDNALLFGFSLC